MIELKNGISSLLEETSRLGVCQATVDVLPFGRRFWKLVEFWSLKSTKLRNFGLLQLLKRRSEVTISSETPKAMSRPEKINCWLLSHVLSMEVSSTLEN